MFDLAKNILYYKYSLVLLLSKSTDLTAKVDFFKGCILIN